METTKLAHIPASIHDAKVGDIFVTRQGDAHEHVDFWQVVAQTKCFLTFRKLRKIVHTTNLLEGFARTCPDHFETSVKYHHNTADDRELPVFCESRSKLKYSYCFIGNAIPEPWDGTPQHFNYML